MALQCRGLLSLPALRGLSPCNPCSGLLRPLLGLWPWRMCLMPGTTLERLCGAANEGAGRRGLILELKPRSSPKADVLMLKV